MMHIIWHVIIIDIIIISSSSIIIFIIMHYYYHYHYHHHHYYYALSQRVLDGGRFDARERKIKPLRASQSLSGYKAFSREGKALRGNHVARIGI